MSAASSLLSEDQFLCSICLDVFTDPVTIPCGHNFCKSCITEHWTINVPCKCPNCKKIFYTRPELQVNTFVSEMVAHFRQSAERRARSSSSSSSSSDLQAGKPGEVPCDVCTGTKLKALKSCMVCLVSYCETHLEPHLTVPGLKRHRLVDPVENLEGRMCTKHDKLLELFCKSDQTCVCILCTVLDHKAHDVVPLKEEFERKKVEVGKTKAKIQQMIQERQCKIKEFRHSVNVSKENTDRELADSIHVFTKLKEAIERNQASVIEMAKEKHRMTEKQAEAFIRDLEREISELKKRSAELEQLSRSEDQLNLVQNFPPLGAAPPAKDWTEVRVLPPSYKGNLRTTVAQLVEMLKNEMKKLLSESDLKTVQQYAVDVTLDPDTAHPQLVLSDDGKQVHRGLVKRYLPDNPKRFSTGLCVLGKQHVSSGRFYFEVLVKRKPDWGVGVARESVSRKGLMAVRPQNGYWTICLMNENFFGALTETCTALSLKSKPEKVGVFVDYEEGLVSFYDPDAASLIYTFTGCSFTEKILPVFFPGVNLDGRNPVPLIICPVNPTE